ncbi:putative metallo-beta-lactamase domain protein [Drechmeria coniospora]|uniref:Putative metallo-beta-lactamase domain protein n=1 Tax=Drechmeria coniospora TaxID=98403 RepID=A0A151GI14_DRECN|nr:putative metallo-beta-lactamase domain protein [Drechmeria coniospora]KYK56681.1 putative metallo-beta-lactamase domain protein [Drechmeria coniospora]
MATVLPPVERLSPACIRILGGNPGKFTLQGTNTYLVGTGSRRILIDTGEGRPAWLESLQATLEEEQATIETALISHWHGDHSGGIDQLRSIMPGAAVYKMDPKPGQLAIEDGQTFRTEGATLRALHTPGHTADHMVFVMEEEDAMFTADNVLGQGTAVFEDMVAYLASLGKMRSQFSGRAYPGHGPVVDDGPCRISEYIAHRRERERQVLEAVAAGERAVTAMDVVQVLYRDVPKELHPAACGGVLQILNKLEREGRVRQEGAEEWRLASAKSGVL